MSCFKLEFCEEDDGLYHIGDKVREIFNYDEADIAFGRGAARLSFSDAPEYYTICRECFLERARKHKVKKKQIIKTDNDVDS